MSIAHPPNSVPYSQYQAAIDACTQEQAARARAEQQRDQALTRCARLEDLFQQQGEKEGLALWARLYMQEQREAIAGLQRQLQTYLDIDRVPISVASHSQKATWRAALNCLREKQPGPDGRVEFYTRELAQRTFQSDDTVGTHLRRAKHLNILQYEADTIWGEDGQVTGKRVFLGETPISFDPQQWRAPVDMMRKVGAQAFCPRCGSKRLRKRVIVECTDCGQKISDTGDGTGTAMLTPPLEDADFISPLVEPFSPKAKYSPSVGVDGSAASAPPPLQDCQPGTPARTDDVADPPVEPTKPKANTSPSVKMPLAPMVKNDPIKPIFLPKVNISPSVDLASQAAREEAGSPPLLAREPACEQAAAVLVEIAGDEPQHAEMNQAGKKYGPVKRPFTIEDARDHFSGQRTLAARLLRSDGKTLALAFDADSHEEWEEHRLAARELACVGYLPLLEDSPTPSGHVGGGHLWLIFDGLVDPAAAYRQVCEIAPQLAQAREFWPKERKNIRLPGGKYVAPGFSAQCRLYDALGACVASTRYEAALAILTYRTPASIVPAYPPAPEPEPATRRTPDQDQAQGSEPARLERSPQAFDRALVAHFNATHPLESIHPLETATHARATWRGEQGRPSVAYKNGRWHDFGQAEQSDGDALDLYCLVHGLSKREVLRDLGRATRPSAQTEVSEDPGYEIDADGDYLF